MGAETYIESIDELAEREVARMPWCVGAPVGNAPMHQEDQALPPAVVLDAAALLSFKFKKREILLGPWLTTQSLSMVYAYRGVGKTHMALGIAYALASGGEFIGWKATKPVKVLYLDGEMPGDDFAKRLSQVIDSSPMEAGPGYLRILTPDAQPLGIVPNLYTPEGQEVIGEAISDSQVIIVDNLSSLVRGGKENEGESWQPVAEWALRQRTAGRSVIFVHHAGKGGQQRGTSKREDLLDTVISLKRPNSYTPDQGACFEVHFEKARALYGEDVDPIEVRLGSDESGRQAWTVTRVSDTTDEQILEMANLDMTTREIGTELGVAHSTVVRALNRLEADGRYVRKAKPARKRNPSKPWSEPRED